MNCIRVYLAYEGDLRPFGFLQATWQSLHMKYPVRDGVRKKSRAVYFSRDTFSALLLASSQ